MPAPRVRASLVFVLSVFAFAVSGAAPQRPAAPRPPAAAAASAPAGKVLLDVLDSELARNLAVLRKQPVPPYFVAYTVYDTRSAQLTASFGAMVGDYDTRNRTFGVDVRTGDYAMDSTREIRGEPAPPAGIGRAAMPLGDSEPGIRLAAWSATDRAYRQSVERLARVKTNLASKVREEDPAPDFSREEPQVHVGAPAAFQLDKAQWRARLRRLSALFAADPLILRGEAALTVEASTRYMVTTEGTRLLTGDTAWRLTVQAQTKAEDGMELPVYGTYFARSLAGLPSEARLLEDVRGMVATLARLRAAPVVDPYSGPAILSGRAAGVFFHEIFGHRIEGSRQKTADDAQTFAKKVDQPILPPFLGVVADPTLSRLGDTELAGSYEFDDEGVRARRVTVVKDGVLREFLMSRSPLARFPSSNGHGRSRPGFRPMSRQSNLLVESAAGLPPAQLVARLRDEARKAGKPYGLLFDQVEGGFTFTGRYVPNAFNVTPVIVYRVYADGRPMELVRGVDLIGTPLNAFSKIIATDNRLETFNGICGAESGPVPVSASSPALLVSEVEVQKKAKSQDALPLLPAPAAREGAAGDVPVLDALKEELARTMGSLQVKDEPRPYFASYSVVDAAENAFAATLGALVEERSTRARVLRTDVRVGDYSFDSSRFFASGIGGAMGSYALLPTDDNETALRRQVWLSTDGAYKTAVEVFSRKKAAFQNRNETDPVPDFTKVPPIERIAMAGETPAPQGSPQGARAGEPPSGRRPGTPAPQGSQSSPAEWADAVKAISAVFARPEVVASDVSLALSDGTRYFVNSEGSRVVEPLGAATFRAALTLLADDGMPVRDAVVVVAAPSALPARAELTARATRLLEDLLATRAAKVGEDFSGPVLVENDAAATLVAQTLVPLFLARRAPDSDDSRGGLSQTTTPYLTRIGNRVLPESFTVKDTPSLTALDGRALGGAYVIDDEGVKAEDVTLVQDGRLKTLLTTRTPHKILPTSNGHARGGGPQAGVFQVESADAVPAAQLKAKYLELLKTQGRPFGFIIRRLASGPGRGNLQVTAAVKVMADGREEAVRGLSVGTITHYTFRDIMAASKEQTVYTYAASTSGMAAVPTMTSVVVPSLIFEELELQKNKEPLQKLPLVPSPVGGK